MHHYRNDDVYKYSMTLFEFFIGVDGANLFLYSLHFFKS